MNPDQAAALLQLEERGADLLRKFREDDNIAEAIREVQAGFSPSDVAAAHGLPWTEEETEVEDESTEGGIFVYECTTARCRQKGRVGTSSTGPDPTWDDPEDVKPPPHCPSCNQPMKFVMRVEYEEDISHMRRTYLPRAKLKDPLARTDKWNVADHAREDDD